MKKKVNIYLLLILVLLIWGIIIYKILEVISPNDQEFVVDKLPEISIDKNFKFEKFEIQGNHRDPFLGIQFVLENNKPKKKVIKEKYKEEIKFPKISFIGIISPKKKGKKTLYLININDNQHFFKVGEKIDEITLHKAFNDRVVLKYLSGLKTFMLET